MLHEWRAAARSLSHRRGLALTVVLTLMLGIGANSAIFSAVDAALLKPLPFPDADRLVSVYELNVVDGARLGATQLVAPVRLEEWNRLNRSFEGLAGSSPASADRSGFCSALWRSCCSRRAGTSRA